MAQRNFQAALIAPQQTIEAGLEQPIQAAMPCRILGPKQARAHHRRQRQRDNQREHQRDADGDRKFAEQEADIAAHQEQRNKYGDQGQRDRDDREADLTRALDGGFHRAQPLFEIAVHVLDDDNRVIDDEAHRDGQGHQRQIVEAVTELVQNGKRSDQGQRHGDGRDDRRPDIAQEQKNYHHHQRDAEQQCELHVADRGTDGLGPVGKDRHLDSRRDRGLQLRQHRLDPVYGRDDVGTGLPLDGEDDRPLLVHPAGEQVVLRRRDRLADIAHADRRAVLISNDQIVVRLGRQQLIVRVERIRLLLAIQRAFRKVDIGLPQDGAHGLEAEAARGQRLRVDLDANCRLLLAADADEADPRNLRDLLQQYILGIRIDRGEGYRVGGDRQHQDRRVRRVDLPDCRRVGHVRRQLSAGGVDRGQNVRCRAIDVAGQIELHRDRGETERARRGHLDDARNLPELLLERRRHGGRHRLRIGARQLCRHGDRRVIHIRQGRNRQQPVARQAAQQQSDHQQHGRDGSIDERGGDVHGMTVCWAL